MKNKCPIESTLSLISGKWKINILIELQKGPVRHGRLTRSIQTVSAKVLTQQLRELENDGLILRKVYAEIPARVEYSLSEQGKRIFIVIRELRKYGLSISSQQPEPVQCFFCKQCASFDNNLSKDDLFMAECY